MKHKLFSFFFSASQGHRFAGVATGPNGERSWKHSHTGCLRQNGPVAQFLLSLRSLILNMNVTESEDVWGKRAHLQGIGRKCSGSQGYWPSERSRGREFCWNRGPAIFACRGPSAARCPSRRRIPRTRVCCDRALSPRHWNARGASRAPWRSGRRNNCAKASARGASSSRTLSRSPQRPHPLFDCVKGQVSSM